MNNYVKLKAHTSSNGMQHILVFLSVESTIGLDFILFNVENAEAGIIEIEDGLASLAEIMDVYPDHVLQILDPDSVMVVRNL